MALTVWSEREPAGIRWTDCTYSSVLMALVYGGFTKFPLGIYSNAERNALESSDDRPDGTGSTFVFTDQAVARRYGLTMRRIPDGSSIGLRAKLSQTGRALALAGTYAGLVAGHTLRRWQPGYVGGHAVCVIPLGGGKVLWLDPLAPMNFGGDITDVDTAMRFAYIPNDAREVTPGEFGSSVEDDMIDPARHEPVASVIVKGGTIYKDPDRATGSYGSLASPTRVKVYAVPRAAVEANGKSALVPVLIDTLGGAAVNFEVGWVGYDQLDLASLTLPNAPAVDCSAAVAAAVTPLQNKLNSAQTAVSGAAQAIAAAQTALS